MINLPRNVCHHDSSCMACHCWLRLHFRRVSDRPRRRRLWAFSPSASKQETCVCTLCRPSSPDIHPAKVMKRGREGGWLFSVQNHSLSYLIHHEWMNHQLNNWFLLIPKPKFGCDTCHCYHQEDHLVGWIKRNQKDWIRNIFLSDFWVPIALIHFFDSGIKTNQIFEWAVFTQLKTA